MEPDFLVEIGKGTKIMKEFVVYPLPKYFINFYFLLSKLPSVDMECRKSNFFKFDAVNSTLKSCIRRLKMIINDLCLISLKDFLGLT